MSDQCDNCRAEALQRQNEAMRAAILKHLDNAGCYNSETGLVEQDGEHMDLVNALSPTAGSDLVTREEHEKVKSEAKKWKHEAEGFNVQFMALMSERDQLRADKEKADAACAEKDAVLKQCKPFRDEWTDSDSFESFKKAWQHALSSDCGKGYVSKEAVASALQEAVNAVSPPPWKDGTQKAEYFKAGAVSAINTISTHLQKFITEAQ